MTPADVTARFVALRGAIGMTSRARAVPRARPPTLIEADYAERLVALVQAWRDEIRPLVNELPSLLKSARRLDDEGRRLRVVIDRGRTLLVRQSEMLPYVAQRYADQTVKHHGREFNRQTKAALGVEVPTLDRKVPTKVGHFITENVSRIRTLGDKTLNDVEDLVARAFVTGQSADELAVEIAKRFDIAEKRARFLAQDQIATLNAQVARMRHQEVGVMAFRWVTRGDSRVRPSHAVKHGRIFPYEGSRAPSFFPGDEVGCRCEEVPVFDEVKARALALAGKGRRRVA
jgi:SPP1 gp7 family putative phage head morphogenesis protein